MKVKQGQLLAVTQGEYSDYCLKDHFRALKDFDTDEIKEQFKFNNKPISMDMGWGASWNQDEYLAWATKEGYIEVLSENEVQEWYIGTYGDIV